MNATDTPRIVGLAKLAVITGGAGVLGTALEAALRTDGWEVRAPGHAELDVCDPAAVRQWFAALPRCDLLVNNAGMAEDAAFTRMTEAAWDRVLDTNLGGTARCTREAARHMVAGGGGVVLNIGSFSAFSGPAGQANYAAAKAGIVGLTRALARELGPSGICINTVLPGFLETRFTSHLPAKVLQAAHDRHCLGRLTTVAEAARFIVFLAGCRHASGQVFCLDSRIGTSQPV